jgi:SAM-dependent methyltransferase
MLQIQGTNIDLLELQYSSLGCIEDIQTLWEKEYSSNSTIPSSHRLKPAHALVQLADHYNFSGGTALDLGCGNGRNSFYLAEKGFSVTAIDFSQTALDLLQAEKGKSGRSDTIKILNRDIRNGLPLKSNSVDLVLDSYCLCHFDNESELRHAMAEVYRVLKPGGRLVKIHLDNNDTYYLKRLEKRTPYGHTSFDPTNGLFKVHMDLDSYLNKFCDGFEFVQSEVVNFKDDVRGVSYERSIFVCVTEKPSK